MRSLFSAKPQLRRNFVPEQRYFEDFMAGWLFTHSKLRPQRYFCLLRIYINPPRWAKATTRMDSEWCRDYIHVSGTKIIHPNMATDRRPLANTRVWPKLLWTHDQIYDQHQRSNYVQDSRYFKFEILGFPQTTRYLVAMAHFELSLTTTARALVAERNILIAKTMAAFVTLSIVLKSSIAWRKATVLLGT